MVFLYILAFDGALVGLSLGVLLPTLFPGISFGATIVLLAGSFTGIMNPYFFPIVGGVSAVVFGVISAW